MVKEDLMKEFFALQKEERAFLKEILLREAVTGKDFEELQKRLYRRRKLSTLFRTLPPEVLRKRKEDIRRILEGEKEIAVLLEALRKKVRERKEALADRRRRREVFRAYLKQG